MVLLLHFIWWFFYNVINGPEVRYFWFCKWKNKLDCKDLHLNVASVHLENIFLFILLQKINHEKYPSLGFLFLKKCITAILNAYFLNMTHISKKIVCRLLIWVFWLKYSSIIFGPLKKFENWWLGNILENEWLNHKYWVLNSSFRH